jgi:hypothetical protein
MLPRRVIAVSVAAALGAGLGAILFSAASRIQLVGWHVGFPIGGGLAGAAIGAGVACGRVRATTAAALGGACFPPAVVTLLACDGTIYMAPVAGACAGWAIAVILRAVIGVGRSGRTKAEHSQPE